MSRNTTTRDRHRRAIARDEPPCGICGGVINYDLAHLDPGEFVVDHIVPINRGGLDTLDNKQAAHRRCNRLKSDRMPEDTARRPPRIFVTSRTW